MGSDLSTADEWVELSCIADNADQAILDISNWSITSRNSKGEDAEIYRFPVGSSVSSGQILVLSNYAAAQSRLRAEPFATTTAMSLPNTKLLLLLKDAAGVTVDTVDDGVGNPMAGNSSGEKASMERIHLWQVGTLVSNWMTAVVSKGFDEGALIKGTPGFANGSFASMQSSQIYSSSSSSSGASSSGESSFQSSSAGFSESISSSSEDGSSSMSESGSSTVSSQQSAFSEQALSSSSQSSVVTEVSDTGSLIVSEVLANPVGEDTNEWIEIWNNSHHEIQSSKFDISAYGSKKIRIQELNIYNASGALLGSGFAIPAQGYGLLKKSVSTITLRNTTGSVLLWNGTSVISELRYVTAPDNVSTGIVQEGSGSARTFCIPTPGRKNGSILFSPIIDLQSGNPVNDGKVTLNLQLLIQTGSLAGAHCMWSYPDGFASQTCNPPSHTITKEGTFAVTAHIESACGDTAERSLQITVNPTGITQAAVQCTPNPKANITISEVLPDPVGDEAVGEWIELYSHAMNPVDLCDWSIDDEPGGSKEFSLTGMIINPESSILLERKQTAISLNNDGDQVRLFAGSGNLVDTLTYTGAISGSSYAKRGDGHWLWTPFLTPAESNRFKDATRRFPARILRLAGVLPNPAGTDEGKEWVEVVNSGKTHQALDGWSLALPTGSFTMSGIFLPPGGVQRIELRPSLTLRNSDGILELHDPDGYVSDTLSWTIAHDDEVIRPSVESPYRFPLRFVSVVSGALLATVEDIDDLQRAPSELRRSWLQQAELSTPLLEVNLTGISDDNIKKIDIEKCLTEEKKFELEISSNHSDFSVNQAGLQVTGYLWCGNGELFQEQQLRSGSATADHRTDHRLRASFLALEREAQHAELGMWVDASQTSLAQEEATQAERDRTLMTEGLRISLSSAPQIFTGSLALKVTSNLPAQIFVSYNSGSFTTVSGATLSVSGSTSITLFAQADLGTGTVISPKIVREYIQLQERYASDIAISEVFAAPISSGAILPSYIDSEAAALEHEEWVELRNTSDSIIDLTGWLLDDTLEGGSTAHRFPFGTILAPRSLMVVPTESFHLALNNGGDTVNLLNPKGELVASLPYGKVKKGMSAIAGCLTTVPTPGAPNVCRISPTIPVKKAKKTTAKKASSKKPAVAKFGREKFVIADAASLGTLTAARKTGALLKATDSVSLSWRAELALFITLILVGSCLYRVFRGRLEAASVASTSHSQG